MIVKLKSEWVSEIEWEGYATGIKLSVSQLARWDRDPINCSREVFLFPDEGVVIKVGSGAFACKQNYLEHKLYSKIEQEHKKWLPVVLDYEEHTIECGDLINLLVCKYVEVDRSKELTADQKLQIQFLSELYDLRDLLDAADSGASKEVDGNFGVGVDG